MKEGPDTPPETDPISPVEIVHEVDNFFSDGQLVQNYNYLHYHFEKYGAYLRARTYLDEVNSVSIFGPFTDRRSLKEVDAPNLRNEAIAYLRRRFSVIDELGAEGYKPIKFK